MGTLYTVGHSTRPIAAFLQLLEANAIRLIADVRTIPKSRHNPQFASPALAASLAQAEIQYRHLPLLGGLRHSHPGSTNQGWRNLSFRGFADYMQSPGFETGLEELEALARQHTVAILCSEAVPWRCHRSLIADALVLRGWTVLDIIGSTPPRPHRMTPFLVVVGGKPTYPAESEV